MVFRMVESRKTSEPIPGPKTGQCQPGDPEERSVIGLEDSLFCRLHKFWGRKFPGRTPYSFLLAFYKSLLPCKLSCSPTPSLGFPGTHRKLRPSMHRVKPWPWDTQDLRGKELYAFPALSFTSRASTGFHFLILPSLPPPSAVWISWPWNAFYWVPKKKKKEVGEYVPLYTRRVIFVNRSVGKGNMIWDIILWCLQVFQTLKVISKYNNLRFSVWFHCSFIVSKGKLQYLESSSVKRPYALGIMILIVWHNWLWDQCVFISSLNRVVPVVDSPHENIDSKFPNL